jgi:replicative DNA helicase
MTTFEDLRSPADEESIAGFILVTGSRHALEIFDRSVGTHPSHFTTPVAQAVIVAAWECYRETQQVSHNAVLGVLRQNGRLAEIGGLSALTNLHSVAALTFEDVMASISIVREYAERRAYVMLGREVTGQALNLQAPMDDVRGVLERGIMQMVQQCGENAIKPVSDIVRDMVSEVEQRSTGTVLPGVPCGFYDLDAMTQGFQRSDLIICAGRPSMGKTSFVLNIARNIAVMARLPVAVFSLEMSKLQLVYRLVSSEIEIETSRLRTALLNADEWILLEHAVSAVSQMPIFIDDTSNITVSEIRSKCRRLQAEQGGNLGLILIDYLQLMEGSSDNRVQELSKITRALKGLARELNVPIIALSQLSRGVESRTNKRPMMSDLRECVVGETLVKLSSGVSAPIASMVGEAPTVRAMDENGVLVAAEASKVWAVGVKPVYRLTLASGRSLEATTDHRIYSKRGWTTLGDLTMSDLVAVEHPSQSLSIDWDQVIELKYSREAMVYDLTVPGPASWLANGIVVHNSGAIEQDADLIMMLYREEYYEPDTSERGIAEVIITKHRNGPTGTVKMLFEPQFTRFRNLATLGSSLVLATPAMAPPPPSHPEWPPVAPASASGMSVVGGIARDLNSVPDVVHEFPEEPLDAGDEALESWNDSEDM